MCSMDITKNNKYYLSINRNDHITDSMDSTHKSLFLLHVVLYIPEEV